MIALKTLSVSTRNCSIGLSLSLLVVSVAGQASGAVTLTFDPSAAPPPGPGSGEIPLPWSEGGFTVSSTNSGAGIEYLSKTGPPYPGALLLTSGGSLPATVTVNISNDAAAPFDLLGFNVLGSPPPLPGVTNYAVVTSSAGGTLTFSLPLNDTTMTFSGDQWHDLSYVRFQFRASGFPGLQRLLLDNIVLQPHLVPEPSTALFGTVGVGMLVRRRLRARLVKAGCILAA
jgi:hypothetical protein